MNGVRNLPAAPVDRMGRMVVFRYPRVRREVATCRMGCWAQCGQDIERGDSYVWFDGRFVYHPGCFEASAGGEG